MDLDSNVMADSFIGRFFLGGRARGWGRNGVGSIPKATLVSARLLMASTDAPYHTCN
jgi:hypothetical protein